MAAIRASDHKAARMLELTILTNVRTDSVRFAKAEDFDWKGKVWIIPPAHLKDKKTRGAKPLRVPLCDRAYEIAQLFKPTRGKGLLFCHEGGSAYSYAFMMSHLHALNGDPAKWVDAATDRAIVVHGFRATFKTWCDETQNFPPDVIREAMGRVIGNQVDRVYSRGDLMDMRRPLMENWERCCFPAEDNILAFPKGLKDYKA
jgi:integrase